MILQLFFSHIEQSICKVFSHLVLIDMIRIYQKINKSSDIIQTNMTEICSVVLETMPLLTLDIDCSMCEENGLSIM